MSSCPNVYGFLLLSGDNSLNTVGGSEFELKYPDPISKSTVGIKNYFSLSAKFMHLKSMKVIYIKLGLVNSSFFSGIN